MTAAAAVLRCAEVVTLSATFLYQPLSEEPDNSQAWSQAVRLLNILANGLTLALAPVSHGWRCAPAAATAAVDAQDRRHGGPSAGNRSAAETLRVCTSIYLLFSAAFWWHRVLVTGSADLADLHRPCLPGAPHGPGCAPVPWLPSPRESSAVSLLAAALFGIDFVLSRRLHRRHPVTSSGGVLLLGQAAACASVVVTLRESPGCANLLTSRTCLATGWLVLAASSLALLRRQETDEREVAVDGTNDAGEVAVGLLALCGHSVAGVLLLAFGYEPARPCPPSLLCLHGLAGAISLVQLVRPEARWRSVKFPGFLMS
ncbi:uncharacterized protein LOC116953051 [Petromyzon marinus]|uniref:uncharacterized protein LOC116953051 n=1 Tax=Petromyzon marinus TaxID=7757 RepID=UPI003F6FC07A